MIKYSFLVTARIKDGSNSRFRSTNMVIIPVTIDKECLTTAALKAAELLKDYTCVGNYEVKFLSDGLEYNKQITSADEVKGLLS